MLFQITLVFFAALNLSYSVIYELRKHLLVSCSVFEDWLHCVERYVHVSHPHTVYSVKIA